MDLFEAMRTTFAARDFTSEPVSDAVLFRLLDRARFAPSGGNRQGWHVTVVRDEASRSLLRDCSVPSFRRYLAQLIAGEVPFNTVVPSRVTEAQVEATPPPTAMVEKLVHAPLLLLVSVDLARVTSFDRDLERVGLVTGGSIYPFVWNLLLAARAEGLGGVITTFAVPEEARLRAHFGMPEQHAIAAMVPIGRPVKQLTKLKRNPVESFATFDRFDGEPVRKPGAGR